MKIACPQLVAPILGLVCFTQLNLLAQHGHINAGAVGTEQDDPLIWANAADFNESSGYVKTLEYAESGRYTGLYQGVITPTALPATGRHGGPDPLAAALGSFLHFRMACLQGPAGGSFSFWESTGDAPAVSLAPGQVSPELWPLSENDGVAGTDPFGHIHGRRFTATKPGFYKVGFTAADTSTNGAGGGPIHTASAPLAIWFQAGVNILTVEPDVEEGHVHVRFAGLVGFAWQVEHSAELGPAADWQPVSPAVVGQDSMVQILQDRAPGAQGFFRLRGDPVIP